MTSSRVHERSLSSIYRWNWGEVKFFSCIPPKKVSSFARSLCHCWATCWTWRRLYLGNGASYGCGTLMTNRKSYPLNSMYHFGPSMMTPNKVYGPQFWVTIYISQVNGARKVKSDVQIAIFKNSDLCGICFLRSGWEESVSNWIFSQLLELSETSQARKLI